MSYFARRISVLLISSFLLIEGGCDKGRPEQHEDEEEPCGTEGECGICQRPMDCDTQYDDCLYTVAVTCTESTVSEVGCGYFRKSGSEGSERWSYVLEGRVREDYVIGLMVYSEETRFHEEGCVESVFDGVEPECDEWQSLCEGIGGAGGEGGAGNAEY